jgi:selenocysteine lyase/cysteine desulfurase
MSDGSSYFLYHSIGQYPGKPDDLSRAMAEFGEVWGACDDGQWAYALGKRASFLERWRAILNAPEGSVTTCESVTQGFHALLTALPERYLRGRRVLVAADAFPSNHFLLQGLEARLGFTLATVPLRQGASWVEPEDFLDRWRPDVGIALLTWVSSTSSHRLDLAPLVAHGRAMGSLVGVDVTQAAGLLPYDAQDPAVDFTISTSLKWMCGTPGAGILHVTPALVTECEPEVRGWFSQDDPFNWDITRFSFAADARRFDSGTPAIVSAVASLPALDWHAGQDRARLLAHNRRLTDGILMAAEDMRLDVVTPRPEARRGGSVMIRLPETHPAPQVVAALRDQRITTDSRGQVLRLSPGAMTTVEGTERMLAALRGALGR